MDNIPWQVIIFCVIIFGAIIIQIVNMLIIKIKVNMCTEDINATIVDCKKVYIKRWGQDLVYYHAIVEFEIDGKLHRSTSFSKRFSEYQVGEKVCLRYSKNKPELCYDEGYDFINNIRGEYKNEPFMTALTKGFVVLLALLIINILLIYIFTY